MLVDGTVVAHGWEQLTSGQLEAPIYLDENGEYEQNAVWTGTKIDGTSSGINCENWKSSEENYFGNIGDTSDSGFGWTDWGSFECSTIFHLYCIQTTPADS